MKMLPLKSCLKTLLLILAFSLFQFYEIVAQTAYSINKNSWIGNSDCIQIDFFEDFGTGVGRFETLYTNYTFDEFGEINDGEYAVSNTTAGMQGGWHVITDHTGNENGRMFVINPNSIGDELYRRTIELEPNIDYTLSFWMVTLYNAATGFCPSNGDPSNITLRIEDIDGNTIAESQTGNVPNTNQPIWQDFFVDFNSAENNEIQFVFINNAPGGAANCGNDLAIDDILLYYESDTPEIINPGNIEQCDVSGTTSNFDLTGQIPIILDGLDPTDFNISFHLSESDAIASVSSIADPENYVNTENPQTIYVRIEKADQPSCFSIVQFDLVVEDGIDLETNLPGALAFCDNEPFPSLDATPINTGIDLSLVIYEWYFDGDLISQDAEITPEESGVYTVIIIYADCSQLTVNIDVNIQEAPLLDLGEDEVFCIGDSFEIIPVISGNTANTTYLWSTGETTPTIIVNTSGIYTLEITDGNCVVSDSVMITFAAPPLLDLGEDETFCDGDSFEIIPVISGNTTNTTYLWSTGETTPTIIVNTSGIYTLEITDDSCVVSDSVVITFADFPEVDLGETIFSCPNEARVITAVTDAVNATFTWFENGVEIPGEIENSIMIITPQNIVTASVYYSVEVNENGCITIDEVEVRAYPSNPNCIISQGLSPDGSIGFNDNLNLEFLANRTGIANLQILNRHGRQVYSLDNYINQWAGQTDDGDKLPTGTYFYVINFVGEDLIYGSQKTGWIYISRESN